MNKYIFAIVILVLVIAVAAYFVGDEPSKLTAPVVVSESVDPSTLPGIITGTSTPWAPELSHLRERLVAIGLPALADEGTKMHTHQHLDIWIHGSVVAVPAGVGVSNADHFISPVHTHDGTGEIHVESPTVQTFTLGQFFDIWGIAFSKEGIGGYRVGNGNELYIYVNGKELAAGTNPRAFALAPHQEIAVIFGLPTEIPATIPSAYDFKSGM